MVKSSMKEITFTPEEERYAREEATGSFPPRKDGKKIADLSEKALQGLASYTIAAKKYDFSERVLTLAEEKCSDPIDLHYCYLWWIKLLYPRRDDPEIRPRVRDYCEKDVCLWQTIRNDQFFRRYVTSVPSFTKLVQLNIKDGNISEALRICRLAASDELLKERETLMGKIPSLEKKLK